MESNVNIKPNKLVVAGVCTLLMLLVNAAEVYAAVNRKAVTEIIQQLGEEPAGDQLTLWINDNPIDPGVKVGSNLTYHISSVSKFALPDDTG